MILADETHCSQSRTLNSGDHAMPHSLKKPQELLTKMRQIYSNLAVHVLFQALVCCRADPLFHVPIISRPGTLANIFIKPSTKIEIENQKTKRQKSLISLSCLRQEK